MIVGGDLKFWVLKKGGPGVIAELWRGGLEILITIKSSIIIHIFTVMQQQQNYY